MDIKPPKEFISIKEASWISVLLVILMFLFSIPTFYIKEPVITEFITMIGYIVSIGIIIAYTVKNHSYLRFSFTKIGFTDTLLLLPVAFSLIVISEFVAGLLPINPAIAEVFNEAFSATPVMFFMAVVCAPLLEEVLCRGVIFQGLNKKYSLWVSIFLVFFFIWVYTFESLAIDSRFYHWHLLWLGLFSIQ